MLDGEPLGADVSGVSEWRLLAYMDGDDGGKLDESRTLAEWQLQDVLRWCVTRGFDNIYLCRTDGRVQFDRAPSPEGVVHTYGTLEETQDARGGDAA